LADPPSLFTLRLLYCSHSNLLNHACLSSLIVWILG
jgi:hypothetical protein